MALGVLLLVSLALVVLAGLTFVRRLRGFVVVTVVAAGLAAVVGVLTRDGFLAVCAAVLPFCVVLVLKSIFETFGEVEAARRPRRRPRPPRAGEDRDRLAA